MWSHTLLSLLPFYLIFSLGLTASIERAGEVKYDQQKKRDVILPAGWTSLGCYTDIPSLRTLGVATPVPGDFNNLTVENCVMSCQAAGYPLAGVEYARECYCDTFFNNGGGPAPDGDAGCNMPCTGNAAEICGGSNRLNVYSNAKFGTSSTTTSSAGVSSTSTTTISTTSSTASTTTTTITTSSTTSTSTSSSASTSGVGITTTSTTVTSTATSTTTTSTTITSSTTTTSAGSALQTPGNLVRDPSFELSSGDWSFIMNTGLFDYSFARDGYSYSGYKEARISPVQRSGYRYLSLNQNLSRLIVGQTYTLGIYTGRPFSYQGYATTYYVYIDGTYIGGGLVCGGGSAAACPLVGNGGSRYMYASFSGYMAKSTNPVLSLQFIYNTGPPNSDVLVDDVSLVAG